MNTDVLMIELTEEERNVLVRGLRYVRRSIMLETREPDPADAAERSAMLDEIHSLAQRLEAADSLTAGVS